MAYTDSHGPDPDGDPVQSHNGGEVINMTIVCLDDSQGVIASADTPSRGQSAPPGPCA